MTGAGFEADRFGWTDDALELVHRERGWTEQGIKRLELTWDGRNGRPVRFPVRDATGDEVGQLHYDPTGRADPKMLAEAGSSRELFPPPETIPDDVDEILILEGESDAVAAWSAGFAAVGAPGTAGLLNLDAGRFSGRRWRTYVVGDCDEVGRTAAREAAGRLVDAGVDARILDLNPLRDDGYDLTDFLLEHGPGALRELLERAPMDDGATRMTGASASSRGATKATDATKGGATKATEVITTTFGRFNRFGRSPIPPGDVAFQGRAGRIVEAIAPNTEASPTGILVSLLTMFGNAVGPRPYVLVGSDRHRPNLSTVLVGPSGSAGRKGMAMSHGEQLVAIADTDWHDRVVRGLVSGEGVIWHVRDARVEVDAESGDEKVIEEGAKDKRLLVREDELASVLAAMAREGSTLSGVLRDAWDGRRLQTLAKNSPVISTGAHVSILAAITPEELLRKLAATEQANGFANRFLWVYVTRARLDPEGTPIKEMLLSKLSRELSDALDGARRVDRVRRNDDAAELWREVYPRLTRNVPGMTGAMRSRAEAQTLRLSLCYALLDGKRLICREHVAAALALWEYAERSLFYIFGDTLGDPTADRILAALRAKPDGLTRTEIRDLFDRHAVASEIERALGLLAQAALAVATTEQTGGRPIERWHAVTFDRSTNPAEDDPAPGDAARICFNAFHAPSNEAAGEAAGRSMT